MVSTTLTYLAGLASTQVQIFVAKAANISQLYLVNMSHLQALKLEESQILSANWFSLWPMVRGLLIILNVSPSLLVGSKL